MTANVVLLRGINVGGHNKLPMQKFRELLESQGCSDVATYIQSGNAVLRHKSAASTLGSRISAAVNDAFGFEPFVLAMSGDEFCRIAAANPFAAEVGAAKNQHIFFMAEAATNVNTDRLDALRSGKEAFVLESSAFYLHAPDGIGRSKLAAGTEKCLGVPSTGRNWRTVCKIVEMLESLA